MMEKEDEVLKAVLGSYDHDSNGKGDNGNGLALDDDDVGQLHNEHSHHDASTLQKVEESQRAQLKHEQLKRKDVTPSKHGNCGYDSNGDDTHFVTSDAAIPGAYHEGGDGTSTNPAVPNAITVGDLPGSDGNDNTRVGMFLGALGFGDPIIAAIAQTEASASSMPNNRRNGPTTSTTATRTTRLRRVLPSFLFRRNQRGNSDQTLQEQEDGNGTPAHVLANDGESDHGCDDDGIENDIEQPQQSLELTTASVVSQEEQQRYEELMQHTLQLERQLTEKPPEAKVVKIEASRKDQVFSKHGQSRVEDDRTKASATNYWLKYQTIFLVLIVVVVLIVTILLFATADGKPKTADATLAVRPTSDDNINNNGSSGSDSDLSSSSILSMSTLQKIYDRGYIICGEDIANPLAHSPGLDMCMALSAALFDGDPSKYEMEYDISFHETFEAIENCTIDISMSPIQPTLAREIQDGGSLSFAVPAYYSGTTFGGIPKYVECAENRDSFQDICRDLSVCVRKSSVQSHFVYEMLPGAKFVEVDFVVDCFEHLQQGLANVMISIPEGMPLKLARHKGYDGPFGFASRVFTRNSPAMTMRGHDFDVEFIDLVNWIFHCFVVAETMNITKDTSWKFPTTDLFGPGYERVFQHALSVMGNYGEMYQRYWEEWVPRNTTNINMPHTTSSNENSRGLLYPIDLGNIDQEVEGDEASRDQNKNIGPTIKRIEDEQVLRCGIVVGDEDIDAKQIGLLSYWNDKTQKYEGSLHVGYCEALAAALFTTTYEAAEKLQLVPLATIEDGFVALAEEDIDVFSGAIFNMANDIKHPVTQVGYNFSPTYFFYVDDQGNEANAQQLIPLAMATRQNPEQGGDVQWSDFVKLVVNSLIYAEDVGITRSSANQMPLLELYGEQYRQALRDTILRVGNYAELYHENIEMHAPRSTPVGMWNTLNDGSSPLHTVHSSSFNWE